LPCFAWNSSIIFAFQSPAITVNNARVVTSARGAIVLVLVATACTAPVSVPPPTAPLPNVSPAPASGGHDPNDEYGMALTAIRKVASFSALLDAASYDRIWTDTDELLRRDMTKDTFVASLEEVHRTYGVSTHSALVGFQFEDRPGADGGTFLYMLYDLDFPTGPAREQFTWRVTASNLATLVAYHIARVTPTPTPTLRG
jgi:hypothetical protein